MTDITPQERQLRETMLPPKPYQPPAPAAPLPRMVPRLNPGDGVTMAGAIEQLGERQEELRKALDKLIEDAVALRALM
jgi:hypothetical protein